MIICWPASQKQAPQQGANGRALWSCVPSRRYHFRACWRKSWNRTVGESASDVPEDFKGLDQLDVDFRGQCGRFLLEAECFSNSAGFGPLFIHCRKLQGEDLQGEQGDLGFEHDQGRIGILMWKSWKNAWGETVDFVHRKGTFSWFSKIRQIEPGLKPTKIRSIFMKNKNGVMSECNHRKITEQIQEGIYPGASLGALPQVGQWALSGTSGSWKRESVVADLVYDLPVSVRSSIATICAFLASESRSIVPLKSFLPKCFRSWEDDRPGTLDPYFWAGSFYLSTGTHLMRDTVGKQLPENCSWRQEFSLHRRHSSAGLLVRRQVSPALDRLFEELIFTPEDDREYWVRIGRKRRCQRSVACFWKCSWSQSESIGLSCGKRRLFFNCCWSRALLRALSGDDFARTSTPIFCAWWRGKTVAWMESEGDWLIIRASWTFIMCQSKEAGSCNLFCSTDLWEGRTGPMILDRNLWWTWSNKNVKIEWMAGMTDPGLFLSVHKKGALPVIHLTRLRLISSKAIAFLADLY